MKTLKKSDFHYEDATNEWVHYVTQPNKGVIGLALRSQPTPELLKVASTLLSKLDDLKVELTTIKTRSIKKEVDNAFAAINLAKSVSCIQFWRASISQEGGSINATISKTPFDPRKESEPGPILLLILKLNDSPPSVELISVERLVDMEDDLEY